MDAEEIVRLVGDLQLSAEAKEKAVLITPAEAERGQKRIERVVVGKIFSKRTINRETLRTNLPKILRTRGRSEIEVIGHNLFVISFFLETDKRTALEEGPWHFFSDLMVLKQTEAMQSPSDVVFDEVTLWVQCHNVPLDCMEPSILRRIGERIGTVEDVDVGESGLCIGKYGRVRVTRRIDAPLVRCVPLAHEQINKDVLIILQYERLPEFCFACGRIGHISKDCVDMAVDTSKCNFDSWLRAGKSSGTSRDRGEGSPGDRYGQQRRGGAMTKGIEEVGQDTGGEDSRCVVVTENGEDRGDQRSGKELVSLTTETIPTLVGRGNRGDGEQDVDDKRGERGEGSDGETSSTPLVSEGLGREKGVGPITIQIISPVKRKGKNSRKPWKRMARETGKNNIDMMDHAYLDEDQNKTGSKRGGGPLQAATHEGPKNKQPRLSEEEDGAMTKNTTKAAAALQPRQEL